MVGGFCPQNFDETLNVLGSNHNKVKLEPYVYYSMSEWKISESLKNPTIQVKDIESFLT